MYSSLSEPLWMVVLVMQPVHSSTMAFLSIHFPLPHRHLTPMLCMERSPMQYISSHNVFSGTSLTLWTTHDIKKSVIDSSLVLTNGLLYWRVVLCGKLQYTVFNSQLTWSSSLLKVPQRTLFLIDMQWNWMTGNYLTIHSGTMKRTSFVLYMNWRLGVLPSFLTYKLANYPFKAMVIKQNACPDGHSNPSCFTWACGLGIGPHIAKSGSNIT